jgi:hypothetical protein
VRLGRALALLALGLLGCSSDTSRLSPEQQSRFANEGRLRHDAGTRSAGWEDRRGSIVVTRQTVLIHKNEKVGIEITPASRRLYEVEREGERIRIGAGSGKSREVWSFVPPDDAAGWAQDIRAVIRLARGDTLTAAGSRTRGTP